MRFRTPNLDIEVSYKKAGNRLLVPRPEIVMRVDGVQVHQQRIVENRRFLWKGKEIEPTIAFRNPDTGEEIKSSEVLELLQNYANRYLNTDGAEVKGKDIQYFALQPDGTEEEVEPFRRTSLIEIPEENWVPAANITDFIYNSVYEIFPETKKGEVVSKKDAIALWKEAELRWKKDQVGVTTFSWGEGFIQYYAFVCPELREGKYVWVMKLSDTQVQFNYLQEIPEKVEIREVPTLKTLPPVQALVVAVKSK